MNQSSSKLILIFLFASCLHFESCYAPLNRLGPVCSMEFSFSGQKASFVNYFIQALEQDAQVYCFGLGVSTYLPGQECTWGFKSLGLVNNGYISTVWDSNSKTPSIQCYGTGKSSEVVWRVTTGVGRLTCQKSTASLNKISVDESAELTSH